MNVHALFAVSILAAALVLPGTEGCLSAGTVRVPAAAVNGAQPKVLRGEPPGHGGPRHGHGNPSTKDKAAPGGTGTFVQTLRNAPFPYSGKVEDTRVDFFDTVDPESGQRFHTNRHGERYSEREHYSDGRVLFHIPPHFDPRKNFAYVLFFHALMTDVVASDRDHELAEQIDASGRNVILVVPQLARNAADSSPGKFVRKNGFHRFMGEVARVMAARMGMASQRRFDTAPILLTAFSGGYKSVAYILDRGGVGDRVEGVFLMDALYEDVDKFERWVAGNVKRGFLVSLYTHGSCEENMKDLLNRLARRNVHARAGWPQSLARGGIHHVLCDTDHIRIPVAGPPEYPLASLLKLAHIR